MLHTESRIRAEHHADGDGNGRSLTNLIKELRTETTTLLRQEVALAKSEMSEKVSRISRNSAYMAVGGVIAMAGLIVLLLALSAGLYVGLVAAGLSNMNAGWLAPLIVGVVTAIIGYVLIQKAISTIREESLIPERTKETLKDDTQWVKEKVR